MEHCCQRPQSDSVLKQPPLFAFRLFLRYCRKQLVLSATRTPRSCSIALSIELHIRNGPVLKPQLSSLLIYSRHPSQRSSSLPFKAYHHVALLPLAPRHTSAQEHKVYFKTCPRCTTTKSTGRTALYQPHLPPSRKISLLSVGIVPRTHNPLLYSHQTKYPSSQIELWSN